LFYLYAKIRKKTKVRAEERKKVVNKGFRGKRTARMKPSETAKKPNETGVALPNRYSFQNGEGDFRRLPTR